MLVQTGNEHWWMMRHREMRKWHEYSQAELKRYTRVSFNRWGEMSRCCDYLMKRIEPNGTDRQTDGQTDVAQFRITENFTRTWCLCDRAPFLYSDVSNQLDATVSFINILKSALHVSADKFAHPQEYFLTVYTAFGTMHRHCCRPMPCHRSAAASVHCTKWCIYSQNVLLRMGKSVARNM